MRERFIRNKPDRWGKTELKQAKTLQVARASVYLSVWKKDFGSKRENEQDEKHFKEGEQSHDFHQMRMPQLLQKRAVRSRVLDLDETDLGQIVVA